MKELGLSKEPIFKHRMVTVAPSWQCDAKCLHCHIPISMRKRDGFDPGLMGAVLSGLPDSIPVIGFTGGEPFFHWRRFKKILKQMSDSGRLATVVTNALWALDRGRAKAILEEASGLGLVGIAVSVDNYHRPMLPLKELIGFLRQVQEFGLAIHLKGVGQASRRKIAKIKNSGILSGQDNPFTLYSLDRVGTAATLPLDRVRRTEIRSCIGAMEPLIGPDGKFYVCCPSHLFEIDNPVLMRGNVKTESIKNLLDGTSRDYLLSAVICLGPAGILRILGHKKPARVTSRCDLCLSVLNRPHLVKKLRQRILESKELRKEIVGRMMVYETCYRPGLIPEFERKLEID